jgi:hypothetical protein
MNIESISSDFSSWGSLSRQKFTVDESTIEIGGHDIRNEDLQ